MRKLSDSLVVLEAAGFGLTVSAEEEYILNKLSVEERLGVYKFEIMKTEEQERMADLVFHQNEEEWRELTDTKN